MPYELQPDAYGGEIRLPSLPPQEMKLECTRCGYIQKRCSVCNNKIEFPLAYPYCKLEKQMKMKLTFKQALVFVHYLRNWEENDNTSKVFKEAAELPHFIAVAHWEYGRLLEDKQKFILYLRAVADALEEGIKEKPEE